MGLVGINQFLIVCVIVNNCYFSELQVSKGKLLETLPKWGRLYTVEADITVKKIPTTTWTNIFHFTIKDNHVKLGDRIPAVWINKAGYFHISSAVNGNRNFVKDFNFDVGEKYHMKIQQFQRDNKIIYEVLINGKPIHSGENTDPKDFENVKVYVSDPWYNPFSSEYGVLENFKYSRPIEGKQITENNL